MVELKHLKPEKSQTPAKQKAEQTQTPKNLNNYQDAQQEKEEQVSRLYSMRRFQAKSQEQMILLQTVASIVGIVVISLGFLFVLLPLLIRFAGNIGNLNVFQNTDDIPPRVPVYAAPPSAIQDQVYELTGFGEPKAEVVVVKNGRESGKTKITDEGEFTLEIELSEGENEFSLFSVDEAGNESSLGKKYVLVFDATAPEIEWETPEDQKTITNLLEDTQTVKGSINEQAKVYLNGRLLNVSSELTFSGSVQLSQGENELVLKVEDAAGNSTEETRKVFFKP